MRAQKHSSSLVGCGDATKAEDHPDVREKVKTWWDGWAGAVVLVFLRLKKRWFRDGNRSVGLFWYVCCSLNGIWSTYWLKMQLANHSMTSESKHQSDWYPENSLACWIKHNHNSQEPASTSVISSHCQRFVAEIHRCFWVKNPPCILKNSSVVRFIDATHVRM